MKIAKVILHADLKNMISEHLRLIDEIEKCSSEDHFEKFLDSNCYWISFFGCFYII